MSGSSTPTSGGSYTEAEVIEKLGVAADAFDCFNVKEINDLLEKKGVKARGKKAQKTKQFALTCTPEQVQALRAEKGEAALAAAAAKAQKREPGQLTIQESVKRMRGE